MWFGLGGCTGLVARKGRRCWCCAFCMGRDGENQRLGKNQGMVRFSDRNGFPFEITLLGYSDCLCEVSTNDLGIDCISILPKEVERDKRERREKEGKGERKETGRKRAQAAMGSAFLQLLGEVTYIRYIDAPTAPEASGCSPLPSCSGMEANEPEGSPHETTALHAAVPGPFLSRCLA